MKPPMNETTRRNEPLSVPDHHTQVYRHPYAYRDQGCVAVDYMARVHYYRVQHHAPRRPCEREHPVGRLHRLKRE